MNKKWLVPFAVATIASTLVACQEKEKEKEVVTKATEHREVHEQHHNHSHGEQTDKDKQISEGYFEDSDITDRPLMNWQGEWQSVYSYLLDGTLDGVLEHKAAHGDKTAGI